MWSLPFSKNSGPALDTLELWSDPVGLALYQMKTPTQGNAFHVWTPYRLGGWQPSVTVLCFLCFERLNFEHDTGLFFRNLGTCSILNITYNSQYIKCRRSPSQPVWSSKYAVVRAEITPSVHMARINNAPSLGTSEPEIERLEWGWQIDAELQIGLVDFRDKVKYRPIERNRPISCSQRGWSRWTSDSKDRWKALSRELWIFWV